MAKKSGKARTKRTVTKTASKVSKKTTSKPAVNQSPSKAAPAIRTGPRRLKHPVKLPSVWRLTKQAARTLWTYRRLFAGIILIYGLLNLILVQGLANNTDISSLKSQLNQVFTGHLGSLASGLSIFAVLVSSSGNGSSQTAGATSYSWP